MPTGTPTEAQQGNDSRVRHWPDLQFWYGLTLSELLGMPHALRRVYERALPRLRAERMAAAIDAAAYPHMSKEAQKKIARRVERATGAFERSVEVPTGERDAAARARAAGIGMTILGPDGEPIGAGE